MIGDSLDSPAMDLEGHTHLKEAARCVERRQIGWIPAHLGMVGCFHGSKEGALAYYLPIYGNISVVEGYWSGSGSGSL